ncbi:UNVERIFIED_CONTAM: hypothetical protein FKN15_011747 [Acipenser sinensis]
MPQPDSPQLEVEDTVSDQPSVDQGDSRTKTQDQLANYEEEQEILEDTSENQDITVGDQTEDTAPLRRSSRIPKPRVLMDCQVTAKQIRLCQEECGQKGPYPCDETGSLSNRK